MPTDAEINAQLEGGIRILQSSSSGDGTVVSRYAGGGTSSPGRFRWVNCNAADDADTQADAIETALGG